jgi:hypothetical protein
MGFNRGIGLPTGLAGTGTPIFTPKEANPVYFWAKTA